jgi:hypothetical protein
MRHRLRQLEFHPEEFVKIDDASPAFKTAVHWIDQKRRWVQTPKHLENAAQRHAAIVAANQGLQPFVAAERAHFEAQLAAANERLRTDRIVNSREYAFCLFPRKLLEQFLLDFPFQAL